MVLLCATMSAASEPESRLSTAIRDLRLARGWTQADVASAMGDCGFPWHQTVVAKIESRRRAVTLNEAVALATVFSVPLTDLVAGPQPGPEPGDPAVQKRLAEGYEMLSHARMLHQVTRQRVEEAHRTYELARQQLQSVENELVMLEREIEKLRSQAEAPNRK